MTDGSLSIRRRDALRAGGLAALGSTAGCLGLGGGSSETLTLGTIKVFPMMQQFVISQQGWFEDELGPDVKIQSFAGGPPLIQAYASGELDLAYVGISPGAIAIAKGVKSKVVAANVVEPNVMVGSERFRSYWNEHGKDAFRKFREGEGRKPTFATLPPGSTPDVFLRFWIKRKLGLDLERAVDIKGVGPTALRSTLAAGKADGGSVIEPIPTLLKRDEETAMLPFRYAEPIMPGQPGAVLQPSQTLVDERPDLVRKLVELHVRATGFIHENREKAAVMASKAIGQDTLPPAVAKEAIRSKAANFISDPHRIVDKTLVYNEFHQQLGKVETDLSEADIFEHRFYEEVADGG